VNILDGLRGLAKRILNIQESEPISSGIDKDEDQWRTLGKPDKALSPYLLERSLKIAYYLYLTNPLCFRIVEICKDFAVGDGVTYEAPDPEVKKVLDDFWEDDVNQMEVTQFTKALELSLSGEQIYAPTVNPYSGLVRLEVIDSLQVLEVKSKKENAGVPEFIVLKSNAGSPARTLKVIEKDRNIFSDSYGRLVGDVFFFSVNQISNVLRGFSDVLALIDWIEGYDDFLYNRMERAQILNTYIWDVTLQGADDKKIEQWLKKFVPPKPGSIRAHNEKVSWKAEAPDLKSPDAVEEARMIRTHILNGAGLPETWFSQGGFASKGTAGEGSTPTLKKLATRQKSFKGIIRKLFRFVIDQAILAKRLSPTVDTSFSINIPMVERNLVEKTDTLLRMSNALMIARENAWLDNDTCSAVFSFFLNQFGFELEKFRQQKGKPQVEKPASNVADNYFYVAERLRKVANG
jgi:hypothetical protein